MEENVNVSVTLSDHNTRGFPNVDAIDGTIAKAGVKKSKTWSFLASTNRCGDIPNHPSSGISSMAHLTPNSKVICIEFFSKVVEITLEEATYMRRKSKPKAVMVPVSLLGKRRFMEKQLGDMSVSEIRADILSAEV